MPAQDGAQRLGQRREGTKVWHSGQHDPPIRAQVRSQGVQDADYPLGPGAAATQAQGVIDPEDDQRQVLAGGRSRDQLTGCKAGRRSGARAQRPHHRRTAAAREFAGKTARESLVLMGDTDTGSGGLTYDQQAHRPRRQVGSLNAGPRTSRLRKKRRLLPLPPTLPHQHRRQREGPRTMDRNCHLSHTGTVANPQRASRRGA